MRKGPARQKREVKLSKMKQNKIIGDKKPGNLDDLFRQAQEDSAFLEAFGEKVEKPEEKKPAGNLENKVEEPKSQSKGTIALAKINLGVLEKHSLPSRYNIRAVEFAHNSGYLALGYGDGHIELLRLDKNNQRQRYQLHQLASIKEKKDMRGVSFSVNDRLLLTGSKDGYVRIYDIFYLDTKLIKCVAKFKQDSRVNDVAYSPDGQYFAVAGGKHGKKDGFFCVYEIDPDEGRQSVVFGQKYIHHQMCSVAFDPSVSHVFFGGKNLYKYTISNTGDFHADGIAKIGWTTALAFSPDGNYLATGHHRFFRIYDLRKGFKSPELEEDVSFYTIVHGLSFSPDGRYLAVTGGNPGQSTKLNLGKDAFSHLYEVK